MDWWVGGLRGGYYLTSCPVFMGPGAGSPGEWAGTGV